MAFQGNPNAGQADPALINMLFQQKRWREEMAWEKEKYQLEMQRQAQLDASGEARKDRESRVKVANGLFDIQQKIEERTGTLGESQAAASEQIGAAEQQYPVSEYAQPAFEPIEQRPAGLFPLEAPDQQNVGIQNQVAEQAMMPVYAQQAAIASSLQGIPELQSLQQSVLQLGLGAEMRRRREAGLAEGVKVADATRDNAESNRRAYRDQGIQEVQAQRSHRRQVAQFGDEITALTDQISAQDAVMATEPPGSPKFARAQILRARLEGGMSKKLTENVDPGHFQNVQKFMDDNVSLMQEGETVEKDLLAFKQLAETDPRFLGTTKGGLISLISSLTEGASDVASTLNGPGGEALSSIAMAAKDALVRDQTISPAQRGKLMKDMDLSEEGVLQARTDAKSLSNRVAYLVTRMQNPGRFANAQYEKNREAYALDTGSAKQAMRNLTTAISEIKSGNRRTRERLGVYQGLLPGVAGGLTTPQGTSVFAPGEQTPFQSTTGDPAEGAHAEGTSGVDALEALMKSAGR